jgi:hypothetical protein
MTVKGSGPIGLSADITAEFTGGTGKKMSNLRSTTWYRNATLETGTFPTTNLSFSSFYAKRATDPAGAGNTTYTPGDYTFVVPLFRNSINFYAWGAGGSAGWSYPGSTGDVSTVSFVDGRTLTAGGGGGGGGGGRRSVGPEGAGGGQSGGSLGENGAGGGSGYNRGPGGNAGGISYGGGTGGVNPGYNFDSVGGNAPGGGAAGWFGYDGSKDPGYSGGGGGGGAGFAGHVYNAGTITTGSSVNIHVSAGTDGGVRNSGTGGAGQVKVSWS